MKSNNLTETLKRLHSRINGSKTEYNLKPYYEKITEIKKHEEQLKNLKNHQLKAMSQRLSDKVKNGYSADNLLFEAFALTCIAVKRVLNLTPFDTQLIGGIAMHRGNIAEMPTGEGKTIAAVFPAFLNALAGNGVHVLTFNDYLARRDAGWMGPVYEFLGIKTGYIQEGMSISDRKHAYEADITYLTAKEAGFDFLRDSLTYRSNDRVHRNFNFAVIDEADSILIDEARIPLVIASASDDYVEESFRMARAAKKLKKSADLDFDEYSRNFFLTDRGMKHAEKLLHCKNLYAPENIDRLTQLNCAIHAEFLFKRDIDYIVRNNKIELVDEFTGRVADNRRWPDGLQAALEAKENISIQSKGKILNSVTLQHFIKKYRRISGMTATALSSEEEFMQFYELNITVIPPHKPCIRIDNPDRLFRTRKARHDAVTDEIIKVNKTGRPVLVGTGSIQESESLSESLKKKGIDCTVLNAKNDEYEAGIIALAGMPGAVTISTNMAGRGTDIRPGGTDEAQRQIVTGLGGLYVIGTNRHESLRIDNQLRGRSGRQGDPGSSCFFVSMEDDIFIKYRLHDLIPEKIFNETGNDEIENLFIKKEVNRVQRIVEGQNLEIKKTLFKYSSLIERQKEIIFNNRDSVLLDNSSIDFFRINCPENFSKISQITDKKDMEHLCRSISLHFIDSTWSGYLDEITAIKEGIHLERLGYKHPFTEFLRISVSVFDRYLAEMESLMRKKFNSIRIEGRDIDIEGLGLKAPSSTWTYLINDDPFKDMLSTNFAASIGISMAWSLFWLWPFLLIYTFVRWLNKNK